MLETVAKKAIEKSKRSGVNLVSNVRCIRRAGPVGE